MSQRLLGITGLPVCLAVQGPVRPTCLWGISKLDMNKCVYRGMEHIYYMS
jgi:hypothetical protein